MGQFGIGSMNLRRRKPRRCFPLTLGPLDPGALGNEGEVSANPKMLQESQIVDFELLLPPQAAPKFPNNIQFFATNYVLDCDELLGERQ